jgi:hypothetical protein
MKFLFFLWLALMPLFVWAQQTPAGRVEESQGDARIYDSAKTMRLARIGEVVYEGDSIVTGVDGEVHLAMEDEGQIAVRPNTRMRIAKYKAEGGSSDTSLIALVQGALRSVTGWIGKYNPKGYAIRTPTATIGVRGTDHETMVIEQGSHEGEAGTYDKVNHGATLLSTQHGKTEVRPNQAGFVSLSGKAKPRVLPSVPTFFRPARLDNRFQNLHDKVRQQVDTKRSQRIEAIKDGRIKPAKNKASLPMDHRNKVGVDGKHGGDHRLQHQERRDKLEHQRQENRKRLEDSKSPADRHPRGNREANEGLKHEARRDKKYLNSDADTASANQHRGTHGESYAGGGRKH